MAKRASLVFAAMMATVAAVAGPILSGCGGDATSSASTNSAASSTNAPFEGTFTAPPGTTLPFRSVTFLDATRFDYVDETCLDAIPDTGDDGDGDDDSVGADVDSCVRRGTYVATATAIAFHDDGGGLYVLPISNVTTNGGTQLTSTSSASSTHVESLVTNDGTLTNNAGSVDSFVAKGAQLNHINMDGSGGLVQNGAVALGWNWINAQMPYCQAVQGAYDSTCDKTCNRPASARNPLWDAYRSDCSGFVSYTWNLGSSPGGGETTWTLPSRSVPILGSQLQPGDILLLPKHHVVLFEMWVNQDKGTAKILEEPRCVGKAQEQDRTIDTSSTTHVSIAGHGSTWLTYRHR